LAERRQAFDLQQFGSALIGLNDKFLALQVAPDGVIFNLKEKPLLFGLRVAADHPGPNLLSGWGFRSLLRATNTIERSVA